MTFDELRRDELLTTELHDPFTYERTIVCKYCKEPLIAHARMTEPKRDELRELRDRVERLEARVRTLETPPPPMMQRPPPPYFDPSAPPMYQKPV